MDAASPSRETLVNVDCVMPPIGRRACWQSALLAIALLALPFTGCQSYVNSPKVAAARMESTRAFSDPLIARAYNAKPTIHFPARIALAPQCDQAQEQLRRLDAAGKLEALRRLPNIASITPLSTLLLADGDGKPTWNKHDLILREAAAKLHADAVFLLKVETNITDGQIFAPLTTVSLGLFPNNRAEVIATALAALVDTRTGYVYGTLERSAGRACLTMSWDEFTRDRTIERASGDAVQKLLGDVPDFWRGVVQAHRL
jgi:hypothetical protein